MVKYKKKGIIRLVLLRWQVTYEKLNVEWLAARLGLTVINFPIFRQARPDFFREPKSRAELNEEN